MNKPFVVGGVCLLLALGLMVWGFSAPSVPQEDGARYFALMTEDIGTEVMQFKQGAQAAAKELGGSVTFLTCARSRPVKEELSAFIESIAAQSPDGVILPSGGAGVMDAATRLGVPVVCLFDSDAPEAASVVTDYPSLGAQLGASVMAYGNLPGYAVFCGDTPAEAQMLEGLMSAVNAPVEVIICTPMEARQRARLLPAGTAIIALSGELTLALSREGGLSLWGVDPGEARVELLRSAAALGLGMEMPYAMGYQAVMAAASAPAGRVLTPARVVTASEMYLSENVKLMFPLLQ